MKGEQSRIGDCVPPGPARAARPILVGLTLVFGACDAARTPNGAAASLDGDPAVSSRTSAATADVTWTGGEMLGQPTDHSVAVKALASQAVETYVEAGTTSGSYTIATPPVTSPDGVVQTVIDGLAANTRYFYRLRYRAAGSADEFAARPEYALQTQRAKGASFTFAIQSDSHLDDPQYGFSDPTLYGITMANIAAAGPDFLLDLGDAVSTDAATETQDTVRAKYAGQRAYFEVPGHASAIFLVLGNHENEEGWNLDDFGADVASSLPVLGANARKLYFLNPVPNAFYSGNADPLAALDGDHLRGDYYAFTWGDALFVAIDPYWYTMTKPFAGTTGGEKNDEVVGTRWDWTLGQQQYAWLKQTLETSQASFKFVFTHQMAGGIEDYGRGGALGAKYCEWGGTNLDGTPGWSTNRPGWASPVHALMVQNHVTAFFHGHDHVYAKETLDGVVYQEVPMAANAKYDTGFGTNASEYAGAVMIANSGYLRVSVGGDAATVDYVRSYRPGEGANGSVAASYAMAGCTADSDADGTHDCYDGCPTDRAKLAPGACGCGVVDPAAGSPCPPGVGGAGGQGGGEVGGGGGVGGAGGIGGAGGMTGAGGGRGGAGGGGGGRGRQMGMGGNPGAAGRRGTGNGGGNGGAGGGGTGREGTGGAPASGGRDGGEPGGHAGMTMGPMGGGPAGPPSSPGGNGGLAGSIGAAGISGGAGETGIARGRTGSAGGSAGAVGGIAGHSGTAGAAGTTLGLLRGNRTTTSDGGGCDCMAAGPEGAPSETSWAAALAGAGMIALSRRRRRRASRAMRDARLR